MSYVNYADLDKDYWHKCDRRGRMRSKAEGGEEAWEKRATMMGFSPFACDKVRDDMDASHGQILDRVCLYAGERIAAVETGMGWTWLRLEQRSGDWVRQLLHHGRPCFSRWGRRRYLLGRVFLQRLWVPRTEQSWAGNRSGGHYQQHGRYRPTARIRR